MTDIPIRGMTQDEVRELVSYFSQMIERAEHGIDTDRLEMRTAWTATQLCFEQSTAKLQSILARTGEK